MLLDVISNTNLLRLYAYVRAFPGQSDYNKNGSRLEAVFVAVTGLQG